MNIELSHALRIKFGTAPNEPDAVQTRAIALQIKRLYESGEAITLEHLAQIVKFHCPSAGHWAYRGIDNTDIKNLLALAIKIVETKET